MDFSIKFVMPYFENNRNSYVLDIGCGSGSFLSLVETSDNKIGIEVSLEGLRIAKLKSPNSEYIAASIFNLPFRDDIFHFVSLWEVIEHIPPKTERKALSEINRIMRNEAVIALSTPSSHIISRLLDPAYFLRGHRHYSPDILKDLFENSHFKVIDVTMRGGLISLISMNVFYFYKHVLRKRLHGFMGRLLGPKAAVEYAPGYTKGFANVFLIARRSQR